jgi:hypothetical protein
MATGRSPGPDGILTEFYSRYWDILGEDFTKMITHTIEIHRLLAGMTNGLITLIPKEGDKELLSNWRPITLLNSAYKIFAKTLQIRLQGLLPDIIHEDQSAFLPLRFILDNVLIQHETISWANDSQQDLMLLKLDFTKVYDVVTWRFLFAAMRKLGIPQGFLHMVQLLFQDAKAAVSINGEVTEQFAICRGVR